MAASLKGASSSPCQCAQPCPSPDPSWTRCRAAHRRHAPHPHCSFTNKERQRRLLRKEARAAKKGKRAAAHDPNALLKKKKQQQQQQQQQEKKSPKRKGEPAAEEEEPAAKKTKKKKKKKNKPSMTERRQRQAEARGKASVTQAPSRDLQGACMPARAGLARGSGPRGPAVRDAAPPLTVMAPSLSLPFPQARTRPSFGCCRRPS